MVIAQSLAQSRELWQVRESISSAQAAEGLNIKHDISIAVSRIPDFVAQAEAALLLSGGEASSSSPSSPPQQPTVIALPRAREVGQSYLTSIFTTLRALWAAVSLAFSQRPDLLLVNGPGTCLPVVVATKIAALLGGKFFGFGLCKGKVCYVESIARTRSLSLTGRILYHLRLADLFFVQWPALAERFPRATCAGRLY